MNRTPLLFSLLAASLGWGEAPLDEQRVADDRRAAIARRHHVAPPAQAEVALAAPGPAGGDSAWRELLAGNRRFAAGRPKSRDLVALRRELVAGQHPAVAVLGCSDSRVSPEAVFDQGPGDLFVVRSAGEVVDTVAVASLEYAVEHLHVQALVVMGHEKCGAVAAAASDEPMPTDNLEALVTRIAPALTNLSGSADERSAKGVEKNVRAQTAALLEKSPALAKAVESGRVKVFQAVYRLASGQVLVLP
jgi:carbonic anhydrase